MSNNPFNTAVQAPVQDPFAHPDDLNADPALAHLYMLRALQPEETQVTMAHQIATVSKVVRRLGNGSLTLTERVDFLNIATAAPKLPPVPRFREPPVFTGSASEVETFLLHRGQRRHLWDVRRAHAVEGQGVWEDVRRRGEVEHCGRG